MSIKVKTTRLENLPRRDDGISSRKAAMGFRHAEFPIKEFVRSLRRNHFDPRIACRDCGVSEKQYFEAYRDNPAFAENYDRSWDFQVSRLEAKAMKLAFQGWKEPVFHQGIVCGSIRKYKPSLMQFMLAKNRPAKYGDASVQEGIGAEELAKRVRDCSEATRGPGM